MRRLAVFIILLAIRAHYLGILIRYLVQKGGEFPAAFVTKYI